jgi:hypothetical protein
MALQDNCDPNIIDIGASNDGSLTTSTIRAMTSADFEAQAYQEVKMDQIIANARFAKKTGVRESMLDMLLRGRIKAYPEGITKQSAGPGQSIIAPFFFRNQISNINESYWKVTAGAAATGAGTGSIPVHAWRFTVTKTDSSYASDIANPHRYFLPGKQFQVETQVSNAYVRQVYEIIDNADATVGSTNQCYVIVKPKLSEAEWNALSGAEQTAYQVTSGLGQVLANSVSDYESWAENEPVNNPKNLRLYWMQTSRYAQTYTDDYLRALNAPNTSEYLKRYKLLPIAEQNKQQFNSFMRGWRNSIFYGTKANPRQTEALYRTLDAVVDPANSGQTLEYKAEAEGFITQLENCSRVADAGGAALNFNTVLTALYGVKRAREADGKTVSRIEIMTDRETAGNLHVAFIDLFKKMYQQDYSRNIGAKEKMSFENQTVINYNIYELPANLGGFELVVIWDDYFLDKVSTMTGSTTNMEAQRQIIALDWSDLEVSVMESNSVTRETSEYDELYRNRIKINKAHTRLNSVKWSAVLEDPNRHYVIRNFAAGCPTLTYTDCDATT